MPLTRRYPALPLALAATLSLLAGCTASVNLAAKRGTYDAYLDLPSKTEARLQEKQDFYNGMEEATAKPKASPYPSLAADLAAMQRAVGTMSSTKAAITAFEGHYDKFSYGKTVVRSDQGADWQEYLGLDQQFQPLRQSMQVSLDAFNMAATDFDLQVQTHHIEEIDADAMRAEIDRYRNHVDETLTQLEDEARRDRQSLDTAYGMGGDRKVLEQKRKILEQMEHSLLNVEEYQRGNRAMADSLYESLPESGSIWTGPGMADDGGRWAKLRGEELKFRQREEHFADLGQQFNAIAWPQASGQHDDTPRVIPPHP